MVDNVRSKRTSLISVITVCLNAEKYIEQCIKSVVNQQFNDFEYIVIDGNSVDGTKKIIEKYQTKISYWHSKPDNGLADAFNEGVKNSKGKWLLFLNSDDYFVSKQVLSKMSKELLQHSNADLVFGQVIVTSREEKPKKIGGPYGKPFKRRQFLMRDTIPHQGTFTNRDLFNKIGYFDARFKIAVDYEHYIRMGKRLDAVYIPILIAGMRDGGLSQKNIWKTLGELHKARALNKALPKPFLLSIYYWINFRVFIGMNIRNILRTMNKIRG